MRTTVRQIRLRFFVLGVRSLRQDVGMTTATLRLAHPDDASQVEAIYAPVVRDTAISFEVDPPGVAEIRQHIEATLRRFPWLVCERDGVVAGYAYAGMHRTRPAYQWSVDVSVYVGEHARRQGVGRRLHVALLALLAAQGFVNAFAGITMPNIASVGLHEALGFTHIGLYRAVGFKLGVWHDVGWWQRRLQQAPAPPGSSPTAPTGPPTALPDLGRAEVEAALAQPAGSLK